MLGPNDCFVRTPKNQTKTHLTQPFRIKAKTLSNEHAVCNCAAPFISQLNTAKGFDSQKRFSQDQEQQNAENCSQCQNNPK